MVILSLDIAAFGMFTDRTLNLRPGMNVITGGNGSGKTTIAAFIKAMLYGLDTDSSTYEEYLPVGSETYGGSMRILQNGTFYTIRREFLKGKEYLSVTNAASDKEEKVPEVWLRGLTGGVAQEIYEETGFMPTDTLTAASLKRACSQAESLSQEVLRYEKAEEFLRELRVSYEQRLSECSVEKLFELQNEEAAAVQNIEAMKQELQMIRSEEAARMEAEKAAAEEAARAEAEKAAAEAARVEAERAAAEAARVEAERAVEEIVRAEAAGKMQEESSQDQKTPTIDELIQEMTRVNQALSETAAGKMQDAEEDDWTALVESAVKEADEEETVEAESAGYAVKAEKTVKAENAVKAEKAVKAEAPGVMKNEAPAVEELSEEQLALLKADMEEKRREIEVIAAQDEKNCRLKHTIGTASLVFSILLVIADTFVMNSKGLHKSDAYFYTISGTYVLAGILLILGLILVIRSISERGQLEREKEEREELFKSAELAEAQYRAYLNESMSDEPQAAGSEDESDFLTMGKNDEALARRASELETKIREAEKKAESLKAEIRDLQSKAALREELNEEVNAIRCAEEAFRRLKEEASEGHSSQILFDTKGYLTEFGQTLPGELEITSEGRMVINRDGVQYSVMKLGTGAAGLVHLAYRLAALQQYDPQRRLPLVLDNVLAGFDADRLSKIMNVLRGLERQVVILSCLSREREIL